MKITRREMSKTLVAGLAAGCLPTPHLWASPQKLISKPIGKYKADIPIVGLGSWITFNVGRDERAIGSISKIIETFFLAGGQLIDSSPMYGSSQAVIGEALSRIEVPNSLFSADKVWTSGRNDGLQQINESLQKWRLNSFNLLQVHNLLDWETQLETLLKMKEEGFLNYVGVTTSHGRRHRDLQQIMGRYPLDFVQLTYNMTHRQAEQHLLPLAQERGIAVIANRPFDGGRLIRSLNRENFPTWAKEAGFSGWADYALKFNASHPAVTCSIPATSQLAHLKENMTACRGVLPDQGLRQRMLEHVEAL